MTLDEYLKGIDKWKQAVSDRMASMTAAERAEEDEKARAWLQAQLKKPLKEAPHRARASA